jgi:glycosyltransferase 2 family protein
MKQRTIALIKKASEFYKRHSRVINLVFQLAVSVVLIVLLLRMINIRDMAALFRNVNIYYFLLLLVIITFDRFFMAFKWHLLLKVKDRGITFFMVVRTYYIGTLIGFFLPTTVGGDLVRVLKLRTEKQKGSDILSSVILERMLGFIAAAILAALTSTAMILFYRLNVWRFLVIAAIILLLFALVVIISFNRAISGRIEKSKKLSGNFIFAKLKKIYLSYSEYKNYKGLLVLFLFLSILEQLIPVIANYIASLALNLHIPLIYFLVVIPVVQLLSRIPISFEGIGINEGLMVYFFSLLGLSGTAAFSIGLVGHVGIILAALPALLFFFKDIRKQAISGNKQL